MELATCQNTVRAVLLEIKEITDHVVSHYFAYYSFAFYCNISKLQLL